MKKLLYILALLIAFCSNLQAQKAKLSKEEFRKVQEKFITEKASLTAKEAKQFFPLYFELQDKRHPSTKKPGTKSDKANRET